LLAVQLILTSAALVSKVLWNPSGYPNQPQRNAIAVQTWQTGASTVGYPSVGRFWKGALHETCWDISIQSLRVDSG
jgi:hypothetical protein